MKRVASLFLVLVLVLGVIFNLCAYSTVSAKVIKIGHMYNEENTTHLAFLIFKEQLEKLSGGKIIVDIYSNAVLGSDSDMLEQAKMGNITATIMGISYFAGEYPQAMVDELPFLYKSPEHWYAAMEGELGAAIQSEILDKTGITCLAYWGIGLPCCYLLGFELGFGVEGVWYGLLIGLSVAAILLLFRFNYLSKKIIS